MSKEFGPVDPNLICLAQAIARELSPLGYEEPFIGLSIIGVDVIWKSLHVYCFIDKEDLSIDFFDASLKLASRIIDYPKDLALNPAKIFSLEIAKILESAKKIHSPS